MNPDIHRTFIPSLLLSLSLVQLACTEEPDDLDLGQARQALSDALQDHVECALELSPGDDAAEVCANELETTLDALDALGGASVDEGFRASATAECGFLRDVTCEGDMGCTATDYEGCGCVNSDGSLTVKTCIAQGGGPGTNTL